MKPNDRTLIQRWACVTTGGWVLALVGLATAVPGGAQESRTKAGPPLRISWTSDRVAVAEGDIVTILIDELTLVSADRNENNVQARGRDLSLSLDAGGTKSGGGLGTRNDVSDRLRGESSRRERFSAEVSTRVVEILPSGILRIEGKKKVQIDKHEQEVIVRGFVRPQDLSSANTVASSRVADAEILYASNGKLGKAGGIWSKLLNLIVP